jgi:hypothetical protein
LVSTTFISCSAQSDSSKTKKPKASLLCNHYYNNNKNDSLASTSTGNEANGTLSNAALVPPTGDNFCYFSDQSYLAGRA